MAEGARSGGGASTDNIFQISPPNRISRTSHAVQWRRAISAGGSIEGDKEQEMANADPPSRDEIDAKLAALAANWRADLERMESKLDSLKLEFSKVPTLWQNIGIAAVGVVTLATIIGLMADRFDGGLAARGLLDPIIESQKARDSQQDKKLDRILQIVEQGYDQPQGSAPERQN